MIALASENLLLRKRLRAMVVSSMAAPRSISDALKNTNGNLK
jgi:hypothetical protein